MSKIKINELIVPTAELQNLNDRETGNIVGGSNGNNKTDAITNAMLDAINRYDLLKSINPSQ
jgi:hypothetical protein